MAPVARAPRVAGWLCSGCGLYFAIAVANPAANLAVAVPFGELVQLDAMGSVALASWTCRLCDAGGAVACTAGASRDATAHLITEHRAAIG